MARRHPASRGRTAALPAPADIFAPTTAVPQPSQRPLKVYAFDPSAGHLVGNVMSVLLRYEKLAPGPVGEKLAVIDYDGTHKTYYKPVDLDDPRILIQGGVDPTESDPRFHQQMVYAVAAETLQRFETALGRRIHWRLERPPRQRGKTPTGTIHRLLLFPHAMYQANAFYSPEAHGILFGYFRASMTKPGSNFPGQTVFTCLSHDIIAHETTHAIVDGIRTYFTEPTNIDVPAFHEAFADLAALFRHFSHKEALLDTLQKTGGALFQFYMTPEAAAGAAPAVIQAQIAAPNPLIQLAQQFGQASGMHSGLRSALGTPVNSDDINVKTEPHDRGAILVAAVFDAYFSTYTRRTADLFRIFRAGGGSARPEDLPGPLAQMLAAEASRTANTFFSICVRALDYCPPVDIAFGDFLRAIITAHLDMDPEDPEGIRDAFMQAFRLRGIVAEGAAFFSEDALCWDRIQPDALPAITGLVFGDPNGLTRREKNKVGRVLRTYVKENAQALGFDMRDRGEDIDVPSFHPTFRIGSDGGLKVDMVVEVVQTRRANLDEDNPAAGQFPLRGGVTLLISQQPLDEHGKRPDPKIRYAIHNHIGDKREKRQRHHYAASGFGKGRAAWKAGRKGDESRFRINFGLIHGGI
ncbi:MAG TPA: hypothetical protein VEI03_21085 [Stellaceae bacterium]|nr:hypothetical protein [Stellaceae bacterium]